MAKKLLAFLILCMALALVRTLLMVLAVVLLLALVHAFVTRPRETMVFIATLSFSALVVAQPLAFITGAVVVALAVIVVGRKRRKQHRRRLCTDN